MSAGGEMGYPRRTVRLDPGLTASPIPSQNGLNTDVLGENVGRKLLGGVPGDGYFGCDTKRMSNRSGERPTQWDSIKLKTSVQPKRLCTR